MSDLCPVAVSQDPAGLPAQPKTAGEAQLLLLKQKKYCDVTFTFPNLPDRIEAHEFCLKARSPVFEQIFRMRKSGNVQSNEIEVSDVTPGTIQQFLEFIYSDKFEADVAGALDLLHLAQKYKIQPLTNQCEELLKTEISVEASVNVFEAARRYRRQDLMDQASDIMVKSCSNLLDIGALATAHEDTLLYLLERDDLTVKEVKLFEFILEWGRNQVGASDDDQRLKDKLKNVMWKIRYANMTPYEFHKVVIPTGLLSSQEALLVYNHFSGDETMKKDMNTKFNMTPRKALKLERFADFYAGKEERTGYASAPFNQCISFTVERTWIGNQMWSNSLLKKAVVTGVKFEWPIFNHKVVSSKEGRTLNFNICIKEYCGPVNEQNWTLKFRKNLLNCKSEEADDVSVDPPVELNSGSTYCVIVEDQSTSTVNRSQLPASGRDIYKHWKSDTNPEVGLELEDVALTLKRIKKDDKFFGLKYAKDSDPIDVIRGIRISLV